MLITTSYLDSQIIADILEVNAMSFNGVLHGCSVLLYTAPVSLSPSMTLTSFSEASFPGYSRASVTWDSTYQEQDNSYSVLSQLIQFIASSNPTSAQSIYGYAVVSTASGTPVLFAEQFSAPISISSQNDAVNLVLQFNFGSSTLSPGSATVIG